MKHLSVASVLVMKRGDGRYMGFRTPIYQLRWRNDAVRARSVAGISSTFDISPPRPIRTMMNHGTTEIFFDRMAIPAASLIGEDGQGFRYILADIPRSMTWNASSAKRGSTRSRPSRPT